MSDPFNLSKLAKKFLQSSVQRLLTLLILLLTADLMLMAVKIRVRIT